MSVRLLGMAVLTIGLAEPQDEVAGWIERLGADSIEERQEAALALECAGPAALEPVERALKEARDPEVRGRLVQIAFRIRQRAEYAKFLGEVRRVTIESKGRPLLDVVREVGRALGEKLEMEGFDGKESVTLRLRRTTMWEALDELARAGDLHYDYGFYGTTVLRKGARPRFPVTHFEHFRVSVIDTKRIERRRLGLKETATMIVLEMRHERNTHPSSDWSDQIFEVTAFTDARGNAAAVAAATWGADAHHLGRPFGIQKNLFVGEQATGPFTVEGTARLKFAGDRKEVSIPVQGDDRQTDEDSFTLRVSSFTQSPSATRLTLEVRGKAPGSGFDARERLYRREMSLIDAEGGKHRGRSMSSGGGDVWHWMFEFPSDVARPQKVVFQWVRDFKHVEVPFRFEGITLPDP